MGTKEYGRKELERIGYFKEGDDPYNDTIANAILELLEVFDNQGHSGFTAPYVAGVFHRLAMFKPASPLTGEDDEWDDVGDGSLQNKRYFSVFKDKDGTAYNIEGKAFTDDGEFWYTCKDSRVNVTFPYVVPDKPEYVYRNKEEQEPAYCDHDICLKNEYNNIGCDECEVTKSQEPCEDAKMTRLEENRIIINEMIKRTELKPTGTYEEIVTSNLGTVATLLADISKSLAILADKAESEG